MRFGVEVDIEKLYPKKIETNVILAPCCTSSIEKGEELFYDPYNGMYHTYKCIDKEIGFIKQHFHPERKHKSGLTYKEREEELLKTLDIPAKFIKRGIKEIKHKKFKLEDE